MANLRYAQKKTPSQPKKRGRVVSSFVLAANAMNVLVNGDDSPKSTD